MIGLSWEAVVVDAEGEASSTIVGTLIVLVLNVAFQGDVLSAAKDVTDRVLMHWWGVMAALPLPNLLAFVIHAVALSSGRIMGMLARTVSMETRGSLPTCARVACCGGCARMARRW